jgi:DNA-binding beta-propeller fold protein YncE
VSETGANRVLRFVQRADGAFYPSVFKQLSGRRGPTGIACSPDGGVFVAHAEFSECSKTGVVLRLDAEGNEVARFEVDGADLSGLALSPDGSFLVVCESAHGSVIRVDLP